MEYSSPAYPQNIYGQPLTQQPQGVGAPQSQQPYGTGAPQMQPGYGANPIQTQPQPGQPSFATNVPMQMQPQPGQPHFVPVIITPQHFLPYDTTCPHCRAQIKTETKYTVGGSAILWCCLLGMMGLVLCCCIPFCMTSCKDATHICPQCQKEVASYKRLQTTPQNRHHRRVGYY